MQHTETPSHTHTHAPSRGQILCFVCDRRVSVEKQVSTKAEETFDVNENQSNQANQCREAGGGREVLDRIRVCGSRG